MSDRSSEVCERIIETDLHADMLNILSWETLSAASLDDPQSTSKRKVVEVLAGVLHNIVRRVETARGSFRKCQAVDVVQKFRDVTKYPVIFFTFLFVSITIMGATTGVGRGIRTSPKFGRTPNFVHNFLMNRV